MATSYSALVITLCKENIFNHLHPTKPVLEKNVAHKLHHETSISSRQRPIRNLVEEMELQRSVFRKNI